MSSYPQLDEVVDFKLPRWLITVVLRGVQVQDIWTWKLACKSADEGEELAVF